MSTGHASSEKNAMKIGRVMLAGSSTAARHFCLCWPCVTVACLVLSGGESLSLSSGISFVQFRCGAAMRSRSAIRCYGMRTYLWRNHIVRCANGRFEFLVLCNSMRDFIENAQSTSFFIHTTDGYSNWWWMKLPLCQWSWQYTVIFSSQRCIQWPPAMPALAKYGKLLRINQHFSQYKTPHTSYGRQLASIKHISSKSLIRIGIRTSGSYITK